MKLIPLLSCACLAVGATVGNACAGEPWVHVGDLHIPMKGMVGKLNINLATLRQRTRHYEIWERITFETVVPGKAAGDDDAAERLTLWAIRCGSGEMARITERIAGAFSPRAEKLRYYVPSPNSSGAAVIETACGEVRRRIAEGKPFQDDGLQGVAHDPKALELPPGLPDGYADEGED